MKKLRWGIMSTGRIAGENWSAIHNSGNSIVTAVASRTAERSREFIAKHQAIKPFDTPPAALGRYEDLLAAADVDAIYLPLPTGLRREWVIRAAQAGKHVLCEKPCATSTASLEEMLAACRRHRVQFMDGVMFMHNPRLERLRAALDDGTSVGPIRRISSVFSFGTVEDFFQKNVRAHSELEPAGCLGDLGWYCLRFTLWAMNWQMPTEVTGRIISRRGNSLSPAAVPQEFSGELFFADGASSSFYSSFVAPKQQWAHISGAKGSLSMSDFVHPKSVHEPSFELNDTEVRVKCCDCPGEHTDSRAGAQDSAMFRNYANQIFSGQFNESWMEQALKTQMVMDACLQAARASTRA